LRWQGKPGEILQTAPLSDVLVGTGTEEDPFLIASADDLDAVGRFPYQWDKHYELTANIDLRAYPSIAFHTIGVAALPFTGVFEGNDHTISNFTYSSSYGSYVGLFGCISGANGAIRNVGLLAPRIEVRGGYVVGSLVGSIEDGAVGNCYVEDAHVAGSLFVGGLAGTNVHGSVARCRATGAITGRDIVGGLLGSNSNVIADCRVTVTVDGDEYVGGLAGLSGGDAAITNCYGHVDVSGSDSVGGLVGDNSNVLANCCAQVVVSGGRFVGGLVGSNSSYSTVANCHASGQVSGELKVGGLLGQNVYYSVMRHCYSACQVDGNAETGGLIGHDDTGLVHGCLWDVEVSGWPSSEGGRGLTTVEMQSAATFLDAGWDFVGEVENGTEDIWWIDEGQDYPRLWWEIADAEF